MSSTITLNLFDAPLSYSLYKIYDAVYSVLIPLKESYVYVFHFYVMNLEHLCLVHDAILQRTSWRLIRTLRDAMCVLSENLVVKIFKQAVITRTYM